MPDTSTLDRDEEVANLLQQAAFSPPAQARDAWLAWVDHFSLDDTPAWAVSLLPAIGANLANAEKVDDSARLSGLAKREWYISSRTTTAYRTAKELLFNTGIEAAFGGGLALSTVWPTPTARKLDDATLVVAPRDLPASLTTLRDAGYSVPSCREPAWHDELTAITESGESIRVSGWHVGPKVTSPERELRWRATFDSSPAPHDQLVLALGRRMLTPWHEPIAMQLRADVGAAINAGALDGDTFKDTVDALGIGALVTGLLERMGKPSTGIARSGAREFDAWQSGSKRHQLWHHPRLAAATGRKFGPSSYLTYRRHLGQHEPA